MANLQSNKTQQQEVSLELPEDMKNFLDSFPLDSMKNLDILEGHLASSSEFERALVSTLDEPI